MPRQTSATYYRIHKQLRHFWLDRDRLYAELSPTEQWLLHNYFQPSKDLTKEQLLVHRDEITKRRPGLPQQAGRAYAKFQSAAAAWAVHAVRARHAALAPAGRTKRGERLISVKAVVRPEPDYPKLARALLKMAEDELAKKREQSGS
jgi:hypothetical protein